MENEVSVHLSIGQKVLLHLYQYYLEIKYEVLSSHRAHAHYLGKGGNLFKLISEIMENQQVVVEEGVNAFDRYRCWFFIKYRNSS